MEIFCGGVTVSTEPSPGDPESVRVYADNEQYLRWLFDDGDPLLIARRRVRPDAVVTEVSLARLRKALSGKTKVML